MCPWSRRGSFDWFQFAYGGRGKIPRIFHATLDSELFLRGPVSGSHSPRCTFGKNLAVST